MVGWPRIDRVKSNRRGFQTVSTPSKDDYGPSLGRLLVVGSNVFTIVAPTTMSNRIGNRYQNEVCPQIGVFLSRFRRYVSVYVCFVTESKGAA